MILYILLNDCKVKAIRGEVYTDSGLEFMELLKLAYLSISSSVAKQTTAVQTRLARILDP